MYSNITTDNIIFSKKVKMSCLDFIKTNNIPPSEVNISQNFTDLI